MPRFLNRVQGCFAVVEHPERQPERLVDKRADQLVERETDSPDYPGLALELVLLGPDYP